MKEDQRSFSWLSEFEESNNAQIRSAFQEIDRKAFIPEQYHSFAEEDEVIPTWTKGFRTISTNSQPSLVAKMIQWLDVQSTHHVLEIGTGTGYLTALLAHITKKGQITSIEYVEELTQEAKKNLNRYSFQNVRLFSGDGYYGFPNHAPYDRIISSVAIGNVPSHFFHQLKTGGKLILPLIVSKGYTPVFLFRKVSASKLKGIMKTGAVFIAMDNHDVPWLRHHPPEEEGIEIEF
jgi:protein-L-isoaspartate(D-aspartate) O-methyltransferase